MEVRAGSLGSLVRAAREAKAWTQEDLGARCEIHPSLLSHIENDYDKSFSPEILKRVAKALGLDPDVVLLANGQLPKWADRWVREDPAGACDALVRFSERVSQRTLRHRTEKMIEHLHKIGV